MADNTNDLSISLGLDPTGLRSGLTEAERLVESSSQRIRSSIERIGNLGQQLAGLGATMTASLTVPIVGLATASIKAYGDIQALQKGLEAVAGSTSLASKQFNELKEVAKLPGLGLQEAVKGSINLQSIGLTADKSKEILLQFGNAVATVGKGRAEFERAIYGVQQLANTDFPLGEDLNIIKDALPQVSNLLKEAFGSSRSDELANMGVSSKQVLDTILKGLTDLPRVNGGIKNAFENLGDSVQTSLGRIGKVIDDNLNISGLIDKLTNSLDKLISGFEDLSPAMQNTVIVLTGLAGATGPVLLGIGGIMAVVPLVVNGFKAIKTAVEALTASMLRNPYTAIAVALAAIATAVYVYYSSLETGKDRQERFNDSLAKATLQAKNEVSELQKLYAVSQDHKKSLDERNKAVDQIQKQYPAYFGNLTNEAILAGKAGEAYKRLTIDITNASRARVAQAELDKRNARRLEEDINLQKKLTQSVKDYNNAEDRSISTENGEVFISGEQARKSALGRNKKFLADRRQLALDREKEDKFLLGIINQGQNSITKLETSAIETNAKTVVDAKKKAEKYVYQNGSEGYYLAEIQRLEELKKRAQFDSDVWRELAKQIETYQELLNPKEIEPVKIKSAGFMDGFGNEFKTYVDLMVAENERLKKVVLNDIPQTIDDGALKTLEASLKWQASLDVMNENLENLIRDTALEGISGIFQSLGESLANGNNALQAIGQSILTTLGGFLQAFGKELIKTALLSEVFGGLIIAIKNAFGNPYVLLALGAAAIAVGAAVSASARNTASVGSGGGKISSSAGTGSGNNYSGTYTNGGNLQGGEIRLVLSGRDAVALINRNVLEQDRLNAG